MDIPAKDRPRPTTGRSAGTWIERLTADREAKLGYKPSTPGQRALLLKLGEQQKRAKPYVVPRTYAEADAKIKKILAANKAREAKAGEAVAA